MLVFCARAKSILNGTCTHLKNKTKQKTPPRISGCNITAIRQFFKCSSQYAVFLSFAFDNLIIWLDKFCNKIIHSIYWFKLPRTKLKIPEFSPSLYLHLLCLCWSYQVEPQARHRTKCVCHRRETSQKRNYSTLPKPSSDPSEFSAECPRTWERRSHRLVSLWDVLYWWKSATYVEGIAREAPFLRNGKTLRRSNSRRSDQANSRVQSCVVSHTIFSAEILRCFLVYVPLCR